MTSSFASNDVEKATLRIGEISAKQTIVVPEEEGVLGDTTKQSSNRAEQPKDLNLVTWKSLNDPLNPKNWSLRRKWSITLTMSAVGFVAIMSASIMAPALSSIAKDLKMNNVELEMALSVYIVAIAFGPLILGPLSEVYGRESLLHACNVWLLVWNIVCGFANSKGLLIAARFLAGFGGSLIYAVGILAWLCACSFFLIFVRSMLES